MKPVSTYDTETLIYIRSTPNYSRFYVEGQQELCPFYM